MKLEVKVYTRPNLRDDEMLTYVGQLFLRELFDQPDKDMSEYKKITLWYPERWTNILEQRQIIAAIEQRCPNMEHLTIVTHSVYIIQVVNSENIGIYDSASKYPEVAYANGVRYCPDPIDNTGLSVFHL